MSHTPGPWTYHPAANYVGFAVFPRGTLPSLASVERPRGNPETCKVQCHNFPGETEANARLIAASPDLLEACQALDELDCCDGYSIPDDDYPKLWAALNLAREAIKKVNP